MSLLSLCSRLCLELNRPLFQTLQPAINFDFTMNTLEASWTRAALIFAELMCRYAQPQCPASKAPLKAPLAFPVTCLFCSAPLFSQYRQKENKSYTTYTTLQDTATTLFSSSKQSVETPFICILGFYSFSNFKASLLQPASSSSSSSLADY